MMGQRIAYIQMHSVLTQCTFIQLPKAACRLQLIEMSCNFSVCISNDFDALSYCSIIIGVTQVLCVYVKPLSIRYEAPENCDYIKMNE